MKTTTMRQTARIMKKRSNHPPKHFTFTSHRTHPILPIRPCHRTHHLPSHFPKMSRMVRTGNGQCGPILMNLLKWNNFSRGGKGVCRWERGRGVYMFGDEGMIFCVCLLILFLMGGVENPCVYCYIDWMSDRLWMLDWKEESKKDKLSSRISQIMSKLTSEVC